MRRSGRFTAVMLLVLVMCSLVFVSCASTGSGNVKRVGSDAVVDLTGYWNDTDVKLVSDTIIADCMNSARIANFPVSFGRLPIVTIGEFKNESDEHMDLSILSTKLRTAIINSGKADFIVSREDRADARMEQKEQARNANQTQAAAIANEDAADFLLRGSVRTIVQKSGKENFRVYYVTVEMVDVESQRIIWTTENDSIRKYFKQDSVKW